MLIFLSHVVSFPPRARDTLSPSTHPTTYRHTNTHTQSETHTYTHTSLLKEMMDASPISKDCLCIVAEYVFSTGGVLHKVAARNTGQFSYN